MSNDKSAQKLQLIVDDPWLAPYESEINARIDRYKHRLGELEKLGKGSLTDFADAHYFLGINYDAQKKGWYYREWAPGATALYLKGDFNEWNTFSHPLTPIEGGMWELFLPDAEYAGTFVHGSRVKVHVVSSMGGMDRIPAYIRRVVQDPGTYDFSGQVWHPKPFAWTDDNYSLKDTFQPLIYECHVGLAQETEGIGTYREFADEVLPRIHRLGYKVIQVMAVQEHPYYGSYGYHVSNFYAPSSRFGSPEDLKYLVNKAHGMGIAVVMDIVHSHSVKNTAEGLNEFDGTQDQYFHPGGRGYHELWDSKLFNYGKPEVLRFLLSNLRYWIEEFHMDGFRFDGITSMLYFHHGMFMDFDHYDKYFAEGVDWDSITYLQLANELVHRLKPGAITISEDMSGMPGQCRPLDEGGMGFDFRLGMGIPDYWIKILKEKRDEDWNINEMWSVMTNRRYKEKTIAYAESHDQALVGDKTIAFWLMDKEMYWHMHKSDTNPVIDRGMALHKLIRLFTISLGGEGYLTFIGNEFGHPEWLDFPREGNNWSYKYARRQWSLVDNKELKYDWLNEFDGAMVALAQTEGFYNADQAKQLNMDEANKVIIFERGNLVFLFNFHPSNSIFDYKFYVPQAGTYKIVLNTDSADFGGHNRIDDSIEYVSQHNEEHNYHYLRIYTTNRTALVLKRVK